MIDFDAFRKDTKCANGVDVIVGGANLQRSIEDASSFKPVSRSNVQTLRHQIYKITTIIRRSHNLNDQIFNSGFTQISGNRKLIAEGTAGDIRMISS